jgi:hypothetical protein
MAHRFLALVLLGATAMGLAAHLLPRHARQEKPAPSASVRFTESVIQEDQDDASGATPTGGDGR